MFITLKIKKPQALFTVTLLFALVMAVCLGFPGGERLETAETGGSYCLVVDAGHGGIDGGAVSISGVKESDINLAIALKLQKIAEFYGEPVFLTRVDDSKRTDAASYSEREDLEHRAELINSVENGVLFSIHQNCYPTSQPSGAQVLYGPGDESKRLGELTHSNIISLLEPENRRVAEPASKGLYITANAKCPCVLVECGFMSSFADMEKLVKGEYQTKLAVVLFGSYMQYCAGEKI